MTVVGLLHPNGYRCLPAAKERILAAIATDLAAYGFIRLTVFSHPSNDIDIIWGCHQDATIQAQIESATHPTELFAYHYIDGDIVRYNVMGFASSHDAQYDMINENIKRWMRQQGTDGVRTSTHIYQTPAYYASQRAEQRTQRRRQDYNLTADSVRQITTWIERIDKKIDDYNATYGEPLPVEYTTVRIPTFPKSTTTG
jgi:hypothetical protein